MRVLNCFPSEILQILYTGVYGNKKKNKENKPAEEEGLDCELIAVEPIAASPNTMKYKK